MRAAGGRGVGREGGDKALAANRYPIDECKSNYYCGRKRHSKLSPEEEAEVRKHGGIGGGGRS